MWLDIAKIFTCFFTSHHDNLATRMSPKVCKYSSTMSCRPEIDYRSYLKNHLFEAKKRFQTTMFSIHSLNFQGLAFPEPHCDLQRHGKRQHSPYTVLNQCIHHKIIRQRLFMPKISSLILSHALPRSTRIPSRKRSHIIFKRGGICSFPGG